MSEEHSGDFLVYGDFLRIFDLQICSKLEDVGKLWEKVKDLEKSLLIGYVSFVLAKAGFHIGIIFKWEKRYTTDFQDDDWIESIFLSNLLLVSAEVLAKTQEKGGDSHGPLLQLNRELTWGQHYENTKTKEMLHVVFVSKIPSYFEGDWRTDETAIAQILRFIVRWLTKPDSRGKFPIAYGIDPSIRSFIVVHPITIRLARIHFKKEFDEVRNSLAKQNISIVSADEFAHRLIPDKQKKYIVKENWKSIRDDVLQQLYVDWPVLIAAAKREQLEKVSELFRRAHTFYQQQNFDQAIRDVGVACEALLRILYYIDLGKEPEPNIMFNDILCSITKMIEERFGRTVFNDLVFIKDWRNKVSHAPIVFPSEIVTFQVIKRSEMFYELFKGIFKPFSF